MTAPTRESATGRSATGRPVDALCAQARRRRLWRRVEPWLYIGPAFVAMAAIIAYPVFSAVGTSLLHSSLAKPGQDTWAGVGNYLDLFRSAAFWAVVVRTLVWAGATLVVQVCFGLVVASVLNRRLVARSAVRTIVIIPWVVPTVLVALIWRFLLDPATGPINSLLRSSGVLENPPIWLADPTWALPTLVVISAWKWVPFTAVILLAGMQQIPRELYEAATVDGANPWQRFVHVTVPGLRTSLALVCLTTISGSINNFNGIWLFTRGGPVGATEILTTLAYRTGFMDLDLGTAAAISVIIFAFMMILATTYFTIVEGRGAPRRRQR